MTLWFDWLSSCLRRIDVDAPDAAKLAGLELPETAPFRNGFLVQLGDAREFLDCVGHKVKTGRICGLRNSGAPGSVFL